MKKFLKKIFYLLKRYLGIPNKNGSVILMYHSISDSKAFFRVLPEEFEKQMRYLHEHGFVCLKLSDLLSRLYKRESLANVICVTFDDGYEDNFTIALPILERYGIPATVFVSTGFIGKNRVTSGGEILPIMNREVLGKMSTNSLIEIMPHGHMHEHLSKLSRDELEKDIMESKKIIEDITKKEAKLFAYPYGDYKEETVSLISNLGFRGSVTVKEGIVTTFSKPLELSRMSMSRETDINEFVSKISKL